MSLSPSGLFLCLFLLLETLVVPVWSAIPSTCASTTNLSNVTSLDSNLRTRFLKLKETIHETIVGQEELVENLLIAVLANGNVLVEGPPGTGKTLIIETLAKLVEDATFQRIQFTPDKTPSEITGTTTYSRKSGDYKFEEGPIFANLVLADEINRAVPKAQSALLQPMAEHKVTVGRQTYVLPSVYLVMATQNPYGGQEEGLFPLPIAQLDRFMMMVKVDYLSPENEIRLLESVAKNSPQLGYLPVMNLTTIEIARQAVRNVKVPNDLQRVIVDVSQASRVEDKDVILFGVSHRASKDWQTASQAHAWLHGRNEVGTEDIKATVVSVLRHRIVMQPTAAFEGVSSDHVLLNLMNRILTKKAQGE